MEIRSATLEDAEPISALIIRSAHKFILFEFSPEGRARFLSDHTPEAIARRMQEGFTYDVATIGGELVGVVGMRGSTHLFHLFVAEPYQGKGIGRRLWEHARTRSLRGSSRGFFTVNASRYAVPVYEKFGFVAAGPAQNVNGVSFVPMRVSAIGCDCGGSLDDVLA